MHGQVPDFCHVASAKLAKHERHECILSAQIKGFDLSWKGIINPILQHVYYKKQQRKTTENVPAISRKITRYIS